jgi:Fe2+ or Zn2+ uptake regulation protein
VLYASGNFENSDLEKVEEHLLICERCQNEVSLTDHYIRAMKKAAASSETGKRLRSIHITEDGPVFGAMHSGADGKW